MMIVNINNEYDTKEQTVMRVPGVTWLWPTFILLFTLAVTLITFLFPGIGIRPVVVMCFLFVIPGMTVVRFFRLNELAIELMLALVLSFTIDAFVAGIVLYAGQWSPKNILSFLIGFCFSGAIAQLVIIRPASSLIQPLSLEDEVTTDLATSLSLEDMVTSNLAKPLSLEDEVTVALAQSLPLGDEVTSDLKNVEDAEVTKVRPAVSSKLYLSLQENTEEKTVSLEKTALSGKEA